MCTSLNRKWICGCAVLLWTSLGSCTRALGDDADNPNDSRKTATTTADSATPAKKPVANSPAPGLTKREQWLLNRVERLEQRVEELEAKDHAGVAASSPARSNTTNETAVGGSVGISASSVGNSSAPAPSGAANANAGFSSSLANIQPGGAPTGQPKQEPFTGGAAATTAATSEPQKPIEPFSDADWTWLNGNPRTKEIYWDTKFFTPEIRTDTNYVANFNHPADHTISGSSELFRSYEVQLEQFGIGGDFHYDNVRARIMTQFGMYSTTTPRNDPSPGHGQWDLANAYRYVSEAYGGYHFNVLHGINVDAGIFMSYIGLFSFYNFDNWAYQPSYVSSNTPWFFNGVRVQIFPTAHLKIEPWFINGWQAYGSANHTPGIGGQIKWTPKPWLNIISNNYGVGQDDLFIKGRRRIHTDDSIEIKYYDKPEKTLDKMAFSLTGDLGCEYGAGVSCYTNKQGGPKQSFIGFMGYNRFWFHRDLFAMTLGGGQINNPGRYLVLIPPINGETAITAATSSPYFSGNPGDPFKAWDSSITFDYMPKQYITFRAEYDYRHASVPYWSGRGGITPPGGNNGSPLYYVCSNGTSSGQTNLSAAQTTCGGGPSSVWFPDLRKNESFIDLAIMVKF
jgi:Putative beta-barrel porin-2, OmpL-like. bbp2